MSENNNNEEYVENVLADPDLSEIQIVTVSETHEETTEQANPDVQCTEAQSEPSQEEPEPAQEETECVQEPEPTQEENNVEQEVISDTIVEPINDTEAEIVESIEEKRLEDFIEKENENEIIDGLDSNNVNLPGSVDESNYPDNIDSVENIYDLQTPVLKRDFTVQVDESKIKEKIDEIQNQINNENTINNIQSELENIKILLESIKSSKEASRAQSRRYTPSASGLNTPRSVSVRPEASKKVESAQPSVVNTPRSMSIKPEVSKKVESAHPSGLNTPKSISVKPEVSKKVESAHPSGLNTPKSVSVKPEISKKIESAQPSVVNTPRSISIKPEVSKKVESAQPSVVNTPKSVSVKPESSKLPSGVNTPKSVLRVEEQSKKPSRVVSKVTTPKESSTPRSKKEDNIYGDFTDIILSENLEKLQNNENINESIEDVEDKNIPDLIEKAKLAAGKIKENIDIDTLKDIAKGKINLDKLKDLGENIKSAIQVARDNLNLETIKEESKDEIELETIKPEPSVLDGTTKNRQTDRRTLANDLSSELPITLKYNDTVNRDNDELKDNYKDEWILWVDDGLDRLEELLVYIEELEKKYTKSSKFNKYVANSIQFLNLLLGSGIVYVQSVTTDANLITKWNTTAGALSTVSTMVYNYFGFAKKSPHYNSVSQNLKKLKCWIESKLVLPIEKRFSPFDIYTIASKALQNILEEADAGKPDAK